MVVGTDAAPSILNNISWPFFLLTGCLKPLLRNTPASSSKFQGQDHFPVIDIEAEVTEQRWVKTALKFLMIIRVFSELVQ